MPKVALTAQSIEIHSPLFAAILQWKFADEFVERLLRDDIPQRSNYGTLGIWVYLDPEKNIVEFGTMCICKDYASLTGGRAHLYIPLLVVHSSKACG